MNRIVSLLLIPMFMLGHVLSHSHAGSGVVEPGGHMARAHVHISGGHQHEHDGHSHDGYDHQHHDAGNPADEDRSETARIATLSVPVEHDSDAVYLIETEWTVGRTVAVQQVDSVAFAFAPPTTCHARLGSRLVEPPDRYTGLPIYLLTASLRL